METFFIMLVSIFAVFCFTSAIYALITLVEMIIDEQREFNEQEEEMKNEYRS